MKTAALSAATPFILAGPARAAKDVHISVNIADGYDFLDKASFHNLADTALYTAKKLGASYADLRVCRYQNESIDTREDRVEGINSSKDLGFGVRVLVKGTWGFAS
ncbi:MAG TPA: DNA gyrase modulator, partial [Verrucomicrobiae bacterium]